MERIKSVITGFENKPWYGYLILIVITIIAFTLRLYKLGEWSFWGDEMFTVGGREDGFNYNFLRQSISLTLIQSVVAVWGVNEWAARLVPAFIGVVSVPVIYFLVKKLFNNITGLLAAILLAVSPWHLYWSQNARFYTALLLFYTLALCFFYFALEEDKPWYLLVSIIFLGLAVKERLLALFFIPVVLTYLGLLLILPFEKPAGLRWRNVALFFLPCLALGLWFVRPYIVNLPKWMEDGFGYVNNNPFWLTAGVVYYVGLPVICLGVLGGLYLLMARHRASLLLGLSAVMPLLMLTAISPFHYTANRYVFVSLTAWIILAALAAAELLLRTQKQVKILAGGALLFLLLQPLGENVLYYRFQNGNRDNWKAAFEYVKSHKKADDLVITYEPELGDYYLQNETVGLRGISLTDIETSNRRVWLVEDTVAQEVFPNVHRWLQENAQQVASMDVHAQARTFVMRVYLYEPEKDYGHNIFN